MPYALMRDGFLSIAALLLTLIVLFAACAVNAETRPASPFGAPLRAQGAAPSAFGSPQAGPVRSNGPLGSLLSWVADTQQSMQRELATSVKRLKSGNAIGAALTLAALSFLYGVVHAVGPGHGKAIISSYVVANEETVRRGIIISFLAAAVQAASAVVLVGVLLIGLNASGFQINAWSNQLESASYALIALVGLYLFATQVTRLWRRFGQSAATHNVSHAHNGGGNGAAGNHVHGHHHKHKHTHSNRGSCEHCDHIADARDLAGPFSWRKALAVVFSVGIRPCTGAILVLVFALTQGLFWAGVAATFAMALGTAITVAVLASLALGSRELALKLGGSNAAWTNAVWNLCAIGGASIILLSGTLLFIASLGPARPF